MSGVAAGKLRHRVHFEAQTGAPVQDPATGEFAATWVPVCTVWGEYVPVSAREFIAAGAEQSEVRGRITIRYRDGIDASMRAVIRGRYFAILGVMEDGESGREHLTVMVAEGVRLDR